MKAALKPHLLPFLALLTFLALTVGGAYLPLGPANLFLALTILKDSRHRAILHGTKKGGHLTAHSGIRRRGLAHDLLNVGPH